MNNENYELTKRQKIIRKKCRKLKAKIWKSYPGAFVRTLDLKHYFIADAFGRRILKDENRVESTSVFGAWRQTVIALHCKKEVDRNGKKFNDEAVRMRMLKKLDAGKKEV